MATCCSTSTKIFTARIVKSVLFVLASSMVGPNTVPSNYTLSDIMATYMRHWFLNDAFPEMNAPPLDTLLSLLVDATVGMNQVVSILTQAFHNQSWCTL